MLRQPVNTLSLTDMDSSVLGSFNVGNSDTLSSLRVGDFLGDLCVRFLRVVGVLEVSSQTLFSSEDNSRRRTLDEPAGVDSSGINGCT